MDRQSDDSCRSAYAGIDRSVAPDSLLGKPAAPLTIELIREGFRQLLRMSNRMQRPVLLPSDLFEVVTKYGWGSPQTLAVVEERYRRQFGGGA